MPRIEDFVLDLNCLLCLTLFKDEAVKLLIPKLMLLVYKVLKIYLFTGIVWALALIVGSPMWHVQRLEVRWVKWEFTF